MIRDSPNVLVDLSQTSYVGRRMLRDVVGALGPDRCLYGTDGPYGLSLALRVLGDQEPNRIDGHGSGSATTDLGSEHV